MTGATGLHCLGEMFGPWLVVGERDGDVHLVGLGAPVRRAEIGERIVGRRLGLARKYADQAKAHETRRLCDGTMTASLSRSRPAPAPAPETNSLPDRSSWRTPVNWPRWQAAPPPPFERATTTACLLHHIIFVISCSVGISLTTELPGHDRLPKVPPAPLASSTGLHGCLIRTGCRRLPAAIQFEADSRNIFPILQKMLMLKCSCVISFRSGGDRVFNRDRNFLHHFESLRLLCLVRC